MKERLAVLTPSGSSSQIKTLNTLLSDQGSYSALMSLVEPVVLPVNPTVTVKGVVPGKCHVFRSAMYPVMITFYRQTEEPATVDASTVRETPTFQHKLLRFSCD